MFLGKVQPGDSYEAIAHALHERACAARQEARFAEAYRLFGELLPLARECRQAEYIAWVLRSWGEAAVFTGNYDVAVAALEEASGLCESLGDGTGHAHCISLLGQIAGNQGRADDADDLRQGYGIASKRQ